MKIKPQSRFSNDEIYEILNESHGLIKFLGRKYNIDGYDEEDLIQEGMLVGVRVLKKFDHSKNVRISTYLYSCIEKHYIKLLRKNSKTNDTIKLDKLYYLEDVTFAQQREMIFKERLEEVYQIIDTKLSDFETEVMKSYLSGKSSSEIARELSVDKKKIWNTIHRAKSKIKINISNY